MPQYFFDVHNEIEVEDEEGIELPNLEAARAEAIRGARDLMAEAIRQGKMNLSHSIEVRDAGGNPVCLIRFGDAVHIEA